MRQAEPLLQDVSFPQGKAALVMARAGLHDSSDVEAGQRLGKAFAAAGVFEMG